MLSISVSSFCGANTLVFNVSEGLDKFYTDKLSEEKVVDYHERIAAIWMVSDDLDKLYSPNLGEEKELNF